MSCRIWWWYWGNRKKRNPRRTLSYSRDYRFFMFHQPSNFRGVTTSSGSILLSQDNLMRNSDHGTSQAQCSWTIFLRQLTKSIDYLYIQFYCSVPKNVDISQSILFEIYKILTFSYSKQIWSSPPSKKQPWSIFQARWPV